MKKVAVSDYVCLVIPQRWQLWRKTEKPRQSVCAGDWWHAGGVYSALVHGCRFWATVLQRQSDSPGLLPIHLFTLTLVLVG